MDSHANDTEDKHGADYIAKAGETLDKKLAALANGEVRSVGTRSSDPIATGMRQLAFAVVKRDEGKNFKNMSSADITAKVNAVLKKNDAALRKIATKRAKEIESLQVEMEV
jgi:hypothetical protein